MSLIPPPFSVKKKIYTVTAADLVGVIAKLSTQAAFLYYELNTDALWNGTVISETQWNDGTWHLFDTVNSPNNGIIDFFGTFSKVKPTNIFPPIFRFSVSVRATQGSCTITIHYL